MPGGTKQFIGPGYRGAPIGEGVGASDSVAGEGLIWSGQVHRTAEYISNLATGGGHLASSIEIAHCHGFCLCFSLSAQAPSSWIGWWPCQRQLITLFDVNAGSPICCSGSGCGFQADDPRNVELQKQVLESLINDILIEQEAARLKVTVSETELDSQIDDLKKKNNLTQQQLQTELLKEGMTLKDFREKLRKDNVKKRLLGYMVHRKAMVTDEEVREYYEQNKGSLPSQVSLLGPRVSGGIGFIMVPTKKDAEELRKKISAGGLSFADAAKRYSIGPGKEQGGSLGDVQLKDLAPPLREALAAVPEGQVTEPVLLDGRAVLLIRTKPGQPAKAAPAKPAPSATDPSFDSVKDKIQEILYQQKVEKLFQDYISNLRSKAVIDIRM